VYDTAAVGVNVTVAVQDAPAGSGLGQVVDVMENCAGFVPVIVSATFNGPVPVFVSSMQFAGVVVQGAPPGLLTGVPIFTVPKLYVVPPCGLLHAIAGAVPVPVRFMTCGDPAALSVT